MRIKIGDTYQAHLFRNGERVINNKGFYHFGILDERKYITGSAEVKTAYLGVKLGVNVSPREECYDCFWFCEKGIYDDGVLRFELKRKIKK